MADLLTAKKLRENRAPVAVEIKRLAELANAEGRDFSAEEQVVWERVNAEYDGLTRSITFKRRSTRNARGGVFPAVRTQPETMTTTPKIATRGRPRSIGHWPCKAGCVPVVIRIWNRDT